MPQDVELCPGIRVHPSGVDDRRVVRRRHVDPVGLGQRRDRVGEVADELVLVVFRVELAGLTDRRAVVVGGVVLRLAEPAPVRAAVGHVEALRGRSDGDVLLVEHVGELVVDQLRALVVTGPAPGVERAALKLRRVQRPPSGVVVADVRDTVPLCRVGAVEALRVGVRAVDIQRADAGVEGAVVVAGQRHGDAVRTRLVLQVLHVCAACGRAVVVLVLDLVGDHRPGAVGELVPGEDAVDLGHPLVRVLEELRVVAAVRARLGRHPAGQTAAVDLGVDVRRRAGDHVDAGLLCHVEQLVDVAHAGEVVDARCRRVVAPVEIDRCRVEPSRLHLLEDVEPQIRARQPEVVELSGPDVGPLAVDQERVAVEADGVRGAGGLRGRARDG